MQFTDWSPGLTMIEQDGLAGEESLTQSRRIESAEFAQPHVNIHGVGQCTMT